jgi:putative spermidine/putrescine transport system permease protein
MRWVLLLLLLAALFALPVALLLVNALSSSWAFPDLLPAAWDGRALRFLWRHGGDIALALGSSTLYSLAAVLLTLLMTILPARLFARHDFTGRSLLEGLLLLPALLPPMVFAMGAHVVFLRLGLADTAPGVVLILAVVSYPYMLRALTAGYQAYGENFAQCAINLGASPLRVLLTVELPLLLPALVAGGTIVFLVAFSDYFLVFLIGGGSVPAYSGYIFPLLNSSDRSVASMLTLVFLVVPLIFFVVLDRGLARYRVAGKVES